MELDRKDHTYQGRLEFFQRLGELVKDRRYTLREANVILDEATINGEPAFLPGIRFRGVGITPDNESIPYRWVDGDWRAES